MQKITNLSDLKASIKELEMKTKEQEQYLKADTKATSQLYKPINLVRMGLQKVIRTPDVRFTIVNTFIGLAAGYLAQKVVVGKSRNIFRRTLGAALQAALVRLAYRNLPFFQPGSGQSSAPKTIPVSRRLPENTTAVSS